MFTGIVEETGTVRRSARRASVLEVEIAAAAVLKGLRPGDSVAVNGCCLTAVRVGRGAFTCELSRETLDRTAFGGRLRRGARVNLERPLLLSGRLDGHLVQGHVDGVGRVTAWRPQGEGAELAVAAPPEVARYLVRKGSVAVEGVSLTVARLRGAVFTVALIPYTLGRTTLGALRPGDPVNLEADVIAKYVERLLPPRGRPRGRATTRGG